MNQKSNIINSNENYQISKATSFDINPQGRKVRLNDTEELRAVKVDEDNLVPAKYKNEYLGMNEVKKQQTIQLYKDLHSEIGIVLPIEKQKLIRSIMKKYWEGGLNYEAIQYYLSEIREIKASHYKQNRIIFDYWGLFVNKIGVLDNKGSVEEVVG